MTRPFQFILLLLLLTGCFKDPGKPNRPDTTADDYNLTGLVEDSDHRPLPDVVVTDGSQCVKTDADGRFFMKSKVENVHFVSLSTPSGYLPAVQDGCPQFFKRRSEFSLQKGVWDCGTFVLYPVTNPVNCTILFLADPQPRPSSAGMDNIAYHSLDCCDDLYREMKDVAGSITDRQVYAVCLGDIVHSIVDLYEDYIRGIASVGIPVYNVIGNHDYDRNAPDDDAGAAVFESYFGPRNYSFNIGKMHFIVLDNLIMSLTEEGGTLSAYEHGLSDDIWEWMMADMEHVPLSTTIMACSHAPMFRVINGSESSETSKHGGSTNSSEGGAYGYGDLLDAYQQVHAWAGHSHSTYNYIYPAAHRHRNVQVHTLARSTGDLYTNEYLAHGTPRGFTVVEVRDGRIASWRFHPTKYQSGIFVGKQGQPDYIWRDWDYVNGIAVMKDTGEGLDDSYQMHVYPPGTYTDTDIYANVFLWDPSWKKPLFIPEGGTPVTMTLVSDKKRHDWAETEFRTFYHDHYTKLAEDGYDAVDLGTTTTLFKAPASEHGSGTVSVKDRFGTTYTRSVSW